MLKYLATLIFFIVFDANALNVKDFNTNKKNYNAKLQIFAKNNEIANFKVAVVRDQALQQYGLMNLKHLDKENGMLFIFNKEFIITMWMKDTFIALDMIFIDKNNIIVDIINDTKPLSSEILSSKKAADKVLEINAGEVKRYGIEIGQKIKYENF